LFPQVFQAEFTAFRREAGTDPSGDSHSVLRMSQAEADEVVETYHRGGVQVLVHAVGDIALDMALSAFARALERNPRPDHRHRVEHMGNYGLTDARVPQARRPGLIAVQNPSTLHYLDGQTPSTYGADGLGREYPFAWLERSGLAFALASHGGLWPVDPRRDIGTGLRRRTRDGYVAGGQALSAKTALAGYTTRAAWAGFGAERLGFLRPGWYADLAVLDAHPFEVPGEAVAGVGVVLTLQGDRTTHDAGVLTA
jgi:predicted amidohydrolase YtcJ